jgi:outer membrane autotransporter barrel domain
MALGLVLGLGAYANALDQGYGNDSYATQLGFDSFNLSVKKRLASTRIGGSTRLFGAAPVLAAPDAYAAPASRNATVGSGRRQLDCVYYSGFTVWADMYQTWARQRSHGSDGYSYRTTGPAIGLDWSSGGWTFGLAGTHGWGKIKGRDTGHKRNTRQWVFEAYGQYDTERFYVNASAAYTHNNFRSQRSFVGGGARDEYNSNGWNFDGEFGLKFNLSNFLITPNVGIRYFRDRHGSVNETGSNWRIGTGKRSYYTLELPVGVDFAYELVTSRAIFVPRASVAWIPEIARRRGNAEGNYYNNSGAVNPFSENGAKRGRNGFEFGLGLEAKLTNSFSAHLDYQLTLRSRQRVHNWNLGAGFTF